jgi:hypothetical protein
MNVARLILEGSEWAVWAICTDRGTCALEEFLQSLDPSLQQHVDAFAALLDRISCDPSGPTRLNRERSHIVDRPNGIYQFTCGRIRVLWFYDDNRLIICSHGFIKKTSKTPKQELRAAEANKRAYLEAKANNRVTVVKEI